MLGWNVDVILNNEIWGSNKYKWGILSQTFGFWWPINWYINHILETVWQVLRFKEARIITKDRFQARHQTLRFRCTEKTIFLFFYIITKLLRRCSNLGICVQILPRPTVARSGPGRWAEAVSASLKCYFGRRRKMLGRRKCGKRLFIYLRKLLVAH